MSRHERGGARKRGGGAGARRDDAAAALTVGAARERALRLAWGSHNGTPARLVWVAQLGLAAELVAATGRTWSDGEKARAALDDGVRQQALALTDVLLSTDTSPVRAHGIKCGRLAFQRIAGRLATDLVRWPAIVAWVLVNATHEEAGGAFD